MLPVLVAYGPTAIHTGAMSQPPVAAWCSRRAIVFSTSIRSVILSCWVSVILGVPAAFTGKFFHQGAVLHWVKPGSPSGRTEQRLTCFQQAEIWRQVRSLVKWPPVGIS